MILLLNVPVLNALKLISLQKFGVCAVPEIEPGPNPSPSPLARNHQCLPPRYAAFFTP
jgi:hypothetical protein